jgi:2-oxoglutarate dehydrogenase E2 component (dihydrolipoamide succinyltransferase)
MPQFELKMPKLGESVEQATITKWFIKEGDVVEEDQPLLEIATDKVDSEIPSPVEGKVVKVLFSTNDLVAVGTVIALINTDGDDAAETPQNTATSSQDVSKSEQSAPAQQTEDKGTRFYSPLVKSIAKEEGITISELENLKGTGAEGRVRKEDVIGYLQTRGTAPSPTKTAPQAQSAVTAPVEAPKAKVSVSIGAEDTIVEMDRMRKLIADHMVMSKHTSPHVTAMVEVDMQNVVDWRSKNKDKFEKRYGDKLTYMPIFMEAVAKALRDFPGVNASVDEDKVILRKQVNLGIAVALPSGNLIVPVVKNADQLNLAGLSVEMNRLAKNARENKLNPDEIQGGTFTITNFGSFKNVMGTPIINQPQVAILATGTIEKKPAVLETPHGDLIVVRHKMFLSLSYDHRVVDGMLGGNFLRRIADYLEQFDTNRDI